MTFLIKIFRNNLTLSHFVYLAYNVVYSRKRQAVNRPHIPCHTWLPCKPRLSYNTVEVECRKIHTGAPNLLSTTVNTGSALRVKMIKPSALQ